MLLSHNFQIILIFITSAIPWIYCAPNFRRKGIVDPPTTPIRRQPVQSELTVGSTIHFGDDPSTQSDNTRSGPPVPKFGSKFGSKLGSSNLGSSKFEKSKFESSKFEPKSDDESDDQIDDFDDEKFSDTERYPRNLDLLYNSRPPLFGSQMSGSSLSSSSYESSDPIEWSPSEDHSSVAGFSRGSNGEDSFRLRSVPNSRTQLNWGGSSNKRNKINFESLSSPSFDSGSPLRRGKRSPQMIEQHRGAPYPPMYNMHNSYGGGGGGGGYGGASYGGNGYGNGGYDEDEDNCQYHTLVNGDSEVLLRQLLPIRLRGRTLIRKCIPPPPDPHDPRYKVLLKGSNQSSFGNLGISMTL